MKHYRISAGNPEGTDWSLDIDHEETFTPEEFNVIAEDAIVYAFEKGFEKRSIAFTGDVDTEYVWEYLKSKGFVEPDKISAYYYLEPYWGKECIKSPKLLEWIDRPEINELPPYKMPGYIPESCVHCEQKYGLAICPNDGRGSAGCIEAIQKRQK
jgi:hypothetical protein